MLTEDFFDAVWHQGFIVLDTCALDFIERCDVSMAKRLMDLFLLRNDQVLVPHHVQNVEMKAYFDSNKPKKTLCSKLTELQNTICDILASQTLTSKQKTGQIHSKTQKFINQLSKYDFQILSKNLKAVNRLRGEEILQYITSAECSNLVNEYDTFMESKTVREFYTMIMDNELCGFTDAEIKSIEREGALRRQISIPPACGDSNKLQNSYGDLFIWKEITENILKKKSFTKVLFITEDKKKGSNWFDSSGKSIHPYLKKEVMGVCGYDAVGICDLKGFVQLSKNFVGEDIVDLIEYMKKKDIQVREIMEEYIREEGYGLLEEVALEEANKHCAIDYTSTNGMFDISNITDFDYDIIDEYVEVKIRFKLEFDVDNSVRYGGDDWESSEKAWGELEVHFTVNIVEGHYEDDIYALDLKNIEPEIIDMDISVSAPFGIGEEEYEEELNFDLS